MTKRDPIDPASTAASLELIHNSLERAFEQIKGVQTKDDAKVRYSAGPIVHMLTSGCFPKTSELHTKQYREFFN